MIAEMAFAANWQSIDVSQDRDDVREPGNIQHVGNANWREP